MLPLLPLIPVVAAISIAPESGQRPRANPKVLHFVDTGPAAPPARPLFRPAPIDLLASDVSAAVSRLPRSRSVQINLSGLKPSRLLSPRRTFIPDPKANNYLK
jgi:hypothetical protein